MTRLRWIAMALMLGFFAYPAFFTSPANATLIIPVGLSQITSASDVIVSGVVLDKTSYMENGRIYTDVAIATMEFIKSSGGQQPEELIVTTLGGRVGDLEMEVNGVPQLESDQEVVLFLVNRRDKLFIYGLHYGLCRVTINPKTDTQMVTGSLFSARTFQNPQTKSLALNPLPPGGEELGAFFSRIRAEIK